MGSATFISLSTFSQVVLVTGASSGIGRALAFELYRSGCKLILAARNIEALERLKVELAQERRSSEAREKLLPSLALTTARERARTTVVYTSLILCVVILSRLRL